MLGTTGGKSTSQLWAAQFAVMSAFSCLNKPQMWNTWAQVKIWSERLHWCFCTQTVSTSRNNFILKHLPFCLLTSSKISAGHPLCLNNPSMGELPGQHSRGLRHEYHHCRWRHGRSRGGSRSLSLEIPSELWWGFSSAFVCNYPQDLWPKQEQQDHTTYLRTHGSKMLFIPEVKVRHPDMSTWGLFEYEATQDTCLEIDQCDTAPLGNLYPLWLTKAG